MLHIIATLSAIALCLLLGTFVSRSKVHHKPTRRWTRCAVCGCYQNTINDYCTNHDLPVYLLCASERQQKRINHHIDYLWTHPHTKRHQDHFIVFVMRLEDLTGNDWSTEAAIMVFEQVGSAYLLKFSEFLLALEEATGTRLDIDDVVTQFLVSEVFEDDQAKVAQN